MLLNKSRNQLTHVSQLVQFLKFCIVIIIIILLEFITPLRESYLFYNFRKTQKIQNFEFFVQRVKLQIVQEKNQETHQKTSALPSC